MLWNVVEHCRMFWNRPIEQDGRLKKVMEPDKNNGERKQWKVMEGYGTFRSRTIEGDGRKWKEMDVMIFTDFSSFSL